MVDYFYGCPQEGENLVFAPMEIGTEGRVYTAAT